MDDFRQAVFMKFDLIIIGGGLAGAALSVALRSTRLSVALVEGHAPKRLGGWDSRIYAYSPESASFLREIGVWDRLDPERMCRVARMDVRGDDNGRLTFSAYEAGLSELAWIGESSLVHVELWESLRRQHNVTLFSPVRPLGLTCTEDGATLHLEDGRVLSAGLVVGADGRDSWVREQVGIDSRVTQYDEQGVVANMLCEHPHQQTAYQWFRDDGVLAWLPLPGKRVSIVWSAPDSVATSLQALDAEAFCRRVGEAGSNVLGKMALESERVAFPLRLMRVRQPVGPSVALIGDAAHAIHPLSGHGINLGFQDARVLARLLGALQPWQPINDPIMLRRYARARAEEPFLLQYATHGLNRLFASRNPMARQLRNLGMNLTCRLPVVTNMLTRYAVRGDF